MPGGVGEHQAVVGVGLQLVPGGAGASSAASEQLTVTELSLIESDKDGPFVRSGAEATGPDRHGGAVTWVVAGTPWR